MLDKKQCRLCDSAELKDVFHLTPTPLANELTKSPVPNQEKFPLDWRACMRCGHVQLSCVVPPERLFREYLYVSGTSPVFIRHFEDYAASMLGRFEIPTNSLVVEIGSNDGTLLRFFKAAGMRVLGVDPAEKIAKAASTAGVRTLPEFFDRYLARKIVGEYGHAQVIVANNVFAHIDNLREVAVGVKSLLDRKGIFVFEVSYLGDVLEKTLFDTTYAEHLDYHSVTPLVRFFSTMGMTLFDVVKIQTHGGSIRCFVCLDGDWKETDRMIEIQRSEVRKNISLLRERENVFEFLNTFQTFESKILDLSKKLVKELRNFQSFRKNIIAYGAPAKATTLIHHFKLTTGFFDTVVDDNPLKQNLHIPGTDIRIVGSHDVRWRDYDVVLILAWNFADSIIQKMSSQVHPDAEFLVPLPETRRVSSDGSRSYTL